MPSGRDLSTEQAATLMGVHARSVLRWIRAGRLRAWQTGGGRSRIRPEDLARFMRDRGMDIPDELAPPLPRIAIVDDDPAFVAALRELLEDLRPDADIHEATDGFSAGMLVGTLRPHLVFLDVYMPTIDGFEVCRWIRSSPETDKAAIVAISGVMTPASRHRLRELGADLCLSKPLDPDLIRSVLREYLPKPSVQGRC